MSAAGSVRSAALSPEPPPSRTATVPRAARALHAATLVVGAAVYGWLARGQWFSGDEWDTIALRKVFGSSEKGLLDPHNEHWSTLAVIVYRAHLALFGLRTYVPLMVLFIAVCVLTAHVLWRFCLRVGCDPYVAAVAALGFLLFGPAGVETAFAWNLTFVGALTCGFAILVLVDDRGPMTARDRWVTWGLGILGVLCSGVALTMLVVVGACLLWSRGWRVAVESLVVPIGVYGIWTLGWGRSGNSLLSPNGIQQVPDFIATGFTYAFDETTHLAYTGVVVLGALAVYVVATARSWTGTRAWALCSALGAVFFYAIVGIRRDSPFLPGPTTGRYMWMAFTLLLPLIGLAATSLVRRWRAAASVAGAVAVVLLAVQVGDLVGDADDARAVKAMERRRVVAGAELVARGLPVVNDSVLGTSVFEDSATILLLAQLARDGDLPDATLTKEDRLGARADLQVSLDHWPANTTDPPARVTGLFEAVATPGPEGCIVVAATGPGAHVRFQGDPAATTAARVDSTFPNALSVAVVRNGTTGPLRPILPFVRRPYRLRLAAEAQDVLLVTNGAPTTLCNVTADPAIYAG